MAAANPVNFQVIKHETGFPDDDGCFLCGELDIDDEKKAPLPEQVGGIHLPNGIRVEVLSGSVRQLRDRELVHLSCHPDQAFHFKCLKQWLTRNPSCPFDRNQVNPSSPRAQVPVCLNDTHRKIQNMAQNIFGMFGPR